MPKFLETLSLEKKNNVITIIDCMKRNGITNTMMQAGIIAVISKESSFIPKAEKDYSKTDNARIRSIFGARLKNFDDAQLTFTILPLKSIVKGCSSQQMQAAPFFNNSFFEV